MAPDRECAVRYPRSALSYKQIGVRLTDAFSYFGNIELRFLAT